MAGSHVTPGQKRKWSPDNEDSLDGGSTYHATGPQATDTPYAPKFDDVLQSFKEMQLEHGYPTSKRNHLACPFWKFGISSYRWVRASSCTMWGFDDIGALNEHIKRIHRFKPAIKGDPELRAPRMTESQDNKWYDLVKTKPAGSREEKWWRISNAVLGINIPDTLPDRFHLHFPGPEFDLIIAPLLAYHNQKSNIPADPQPSAAQKEPPDPFASGVNSMTLGIGGLEGERTHFQQNAAATEATPTVYSHDAELDSVRFFQQGIQAPSYLGGEADDGLLFNIGNIDAFGRPTGHPFHPPDDNL